MPRFFGRSKGKKDAKEKQQSHTSPQHTHIVVYGADKKHHSSPTVSSSGLQEGESNSPSPTASAQDEVGKLIPESWNRGSSKASMSRRNSGKNVAAHKAFYEDLSTKSTAVSPGPGTDSPRRVSSPEKRRPREDLGLSSGSGNKISISVLSPTSGGSRTPTLPDRYSKSFTDFMGSSSPISKRMSMNLESSPATTEIGREKEFEGISLPLPPLQTTAVRLREVDARRNPQGGGFGFILRKSYVPMLDEPDKTKLVHLIEPRSDYFGPLMTGDRIIEVNGELVEDAPHEVVVDLIKSSGDCVNLKVASMPELMELNNRGALDNTFERNTGHRKSGKAKQGTGTLRRQGKVKNSFKAKTEAEVLSEKEGLFQERVWVVHRGGFCLGTVVQDSPKKSTAFSTHVRLFKVQGKETVRVQLDQTGEIIEVEDDDLEKANPMSLDKVEDLVKLVNLNESSVLHVMRQRYGSSLIHTFAGRHLLIVNPLKPLSSYSDRVIDMFRGCRREDMPPHIFAMGQQAYRDMMVTRQDQSLILMGLSGSGKTFNMRYLLRYLTTIGQPEHGPVTNAKLDAVELLLHSFSSAATFLNPQATRCACLYSLSFDPSGTLVGTSIQTYLLEKNRISQRTLGEGNFNIFHQLLLGADEQLSADLLLDAQAETEDPNLYCEELDDPQREESAGYVWDLIQNCLEILGISEEEAIGLWSLLAAIYHLGFAGVRKGSVRGGDYFLNPAAAQRAATLLGVDHETLGQDIFSPPRGGTLRHSNMFSSSMSSPTQQSDTTSITSSLFLTNMGGNRSSYLDGFVMGLYEQAFNALVMLINRSLQPQLGSKGRSVIHVLDTPGFQHRELAGARNGASFDDLCMNYVQERLQMLFHDVTFTSEQDRYIQEEINWMFSEVVTSPLAVIDTIDKHVPQRRGGSVDLHNDRRGLLWILDEESVFPGATDTSFLDRVQIYHGAVERGETPIIKVIKEDNQFVVSHCQRTLPILYDANEWVRRAREHPSFRVVVNTLAASKSPSIATIFQGRGVAASATTLGTSQLKADTHRSLNRSGSSHGGGMPFTSPSGGIKKSSRCLQTKFKIDFLVDMLRKTRQWFIRCILPQLPHKLPGALPSPDPSLAAEQEQGPLTYMDIDIPLVRDQLKRAEMVKATRIYKQGYPEHISFDEFCRRYKGLLPADVTDGEPGMSKKDSVEMVLYSQAVDKNTYRMGLSQTFLRAGTLTSLDRAMEERIHGTMVLFQARCKGWVGRQRFKQLQVQDSAALVIQQNVWSYLEVRDWSWWKLFLKVKPMLAIWRAEEDIKDRESKIEKLKAKVEAIESERDSLKESEANLEAKVTQLSAQLDDIQSSANEASEMMEGEQVERRELEEKLAETMAHEAELTSVNEQLHMQIAEMSILARIKQTEEGEENSDSIVERYYEARRELETLRQRVSSEFEDQIESLQSSKRSLEKKLADSESERDDLHKTLAQVRKKATKVGTEMNDLKLHLEAQQARNAELEKRQRKFDMDLSAAKDDSNSEVQAKVKLAKEKELLFTELSELKEKLKVVEEDNKRLSQEKEDLESELVSNTTMTTESEVSSLKRIKRDMEAKIVELEDELDEASLKLDNVQQSKARLELSNQTLKQQHAQELEGREEELEQIKVTLNKKLKSLSQQLDEVHEEKQAAVKARRDMERDLLDYQSKLGDPETEKKLKKQIRKLKVLLGDTEEQLEHERESRGNSALIKSLKNQLEEAQTSEASAVKNYKWLQGDMDELQGRYDDTLRHKNEAELRVTELSRAKEELESRIEEDQDEIEELLEKQRTHISQVSSIQSQLAEANFQVEELSETKAGLESKVESLQSRVSELEDGINKHQYEASEHKVKELEQKLELERSSARRHESQISRLRHQLERMQGEKSEDVSHKNMDALNRAQKQIRELRAELQEAERKEQEMSKKRRNAEGRVEELEVQLQSTQADLKSAKKRIEQLHGALNHEEEGFSGDDDDLQYTSSRGDSLDNLSSTGSSYSLEGGASLDFSDEDDEDNVTMMSKTSRSLDRKRSKEVSPVVEYKSRRTASKDLAEEDEFEASRKARQRRLQQLEEEEQAESSRRARKERLKSLEEDDPFEASRRARQERLKDLMDDDDDLEASRKARQRRLQEPDKEESVKRKSSLPSSSRHTKKTYDDEDDEDDDDLEEFLMKQKERMLRLADSDDEEEEEHKSSTLKSSHRSADPPVTNGNTNGVHSSKKPESREQSEEPRAVKSHRDSVDEGETSRQKRKRHRRRTIEQLTSPEHQAAKANGVDL